MASPFVSVIIPILNDTEKLKKCLQTLEKQTYSDDSYEVIVVDNGSEEDIEPEIKEFRHSVFAHESFLSLHAARNKGISVAKGPVLAFTDADCIPASDWIEKGVRSLINTENCGLVAGKIEVFAEDPKKPTAAELFEILTAFRQKEYIEKWHFGATANVFTKKEVIDKVGYLNGKLKSGGDLEWGNRVYKAGYSQIYADDVLIKHPARRTIRELYKKHIRIIKGLSLIRGVSSMNLRQVTVEIKDTWPRIEDTLVVAKDQRQDKMTRVKLTIIMLSIKIVRCLEIFRSSLR